MQKIIALTLVTFSMIFALKSQIVNDIHLKDFDHKYIQILGTKKLFGKKIFIKIDYGQAIKGCRGKSNILKNKSGYKFTFNSMIGVLNYLNQFGYEFKDAYVITVGIFSQNVYHYVLEKNETINLLKTEKNITKKESEIIEKSSEVVDREFQEIKTVIDCKEEIKTDRISKIILYRRGSSGDPINFKLNDQEFLNFNPGSYKELELNTGDKIKFTSKNLNEECQFIELSQETIQYIDVKYNQESGASFILVPEYIGKVHSLRPKIQSSQPFIDNK